MNNSKALYRVTALGEFADASVEHAYQAHMQPLLARHLRVALMVWGSLILLFGVLDLQSLGWSRDFYILLACRALQATLLFTFAFMLKRRPQLVSSG
ncbi:MAG: hypothetical protein QNL70_01375, partial [Pseudomonas sp.]